MRLVGRRQKAGGKGKGGKGKDGKGKGKGKKPAADSPALQEALTRACQWGSVAFSHVSQMSDTRVEHIERSFHVGTPVKCRVIGASPNARP